MAIILDSTGTHSVCFITKNYTGQSCSRVRQVFVLKSKCFIFAMIFMMCCFYVGFRMADDTDESGSTASVPAVSETITPTDYGQDMIDILKQMLGFMAGGNADVTFPSVTSTSEIGSVTTNAPTENTNPRDIYEFDYSAVPDGETAIVPYDLSLSSYGETFIYNDTRTGDKN